MNPVSVVMPVKNGGRFIRQALDSVRCEGVSQLIVVDDHSTDDTAHCVHMGAWPGVRLVSASAEKHGISNARNEGLSFVTQQWVAFIDADDIWLSGKTRLQIKALLSCGTPYEAYASSKVEHFVEPGHAMPAAIDPAKFGVIDLNIPSNLLCHRGVLEKVGGFDPELMHGEDVDWYNRAHKLGIQRIHVDEVLVKKRVHDTNMSLRHGIAAERVQLAKILLRKVTKTMFPIWPDP